MVDRLSLRLFVASVLVATIDPEADAVATGRGGDEPEPDAAARRGAPAHHVLHDADPFRVAAGGGDQGGPAARRRRRRCRGPTWRSTAWWWWSTRGGGCWSTDEALEGPAAEAWWAEQATRRREGQETLGGPVEDLPTVVVVRADKDASYGTVRRTLTTAQERGFAHFSLVVLRSRPR